MITKTERIIWAALFVLLVIVCGVLLLKVAAGEHIPLPTGTAPVASPSAKPTMLPTLLIPTDTATATATDAPYLTDTPAATDTPEPPTATATFWPSPTMEAGCAITGALNVRNVPSLSGVVTRVLAAGDWVIIDTGQAPVHAGGYVWYALDGGGWAANHRMVCG